VNATFPDVTGPPGSVRLSVPERVPPLCAPVTAARRARSVAVVDDREGAVQAGGDVEIARAGRVTSKLIE
jgi:hypothetical protein